MIARAAQGPFASWRHPTLGIADLFAGESRRRAQRWSAGGKSVRSIAVALRLSDEEVRAMLQPDGAA